MESQAQRPASMEHIPRRPPRPRRDRWTDRHSRRTLRRPTMGNCQLFQPTRPPTSRHRRREVLSLLVWLSVNCTKFVWCLNSTWPELDWISKENCFSPVPPQMSIHPVLSHRNRTKRCRTSDLTSSSPALRSPTPDRVIVRNLEELLGPQSRQCSRPMKMIFALPSDASAAARLAFHVQRPSNCVARSPLRHDNCVHAAIHRHRPRR